MGNKKGGPVAEPPKAASAAETAQLAQKLPDRAAIGVAVGIASEEEHLTNLLLFIFGGCHVSRGQQDCNRNVTFLQAVNTGKTGHCVVIWSQEG